MKTKILGILALLCSLHAAAQTPTTHLQMVWQTTVGGNSSEFIGGFEQLSSGDYLLSTTTFSDSTAIFNCGVPPQSGAMKIMLSVLDSNGNFAQHVCVPAKIWAFSGGITKTNDGGFAVTGDSPSIYPSDLGRLYAYIAKFDANYNLQWHKSIGSQGGEGHGSNMIQLHDSSLVTVGYTTSKNNSNYPFLASGKRAPHYIKFRPSAPFHINSVVHCPANSLGGEARDIKQVNDSTLAMIGTYDVGGINTAIMFATMNLQATQVTHHYYGGGLTESGTSFVIAPNGDYILAGGSNSNDSIVPNHSSGFTDGFVLRINPQGQLIWKKCYGNVGNDFIGKIIADPNNNEQYYMLGEYSQPATTLGGPGALVAWIMKIDGTTGTLLWEELIDCSPGYDVFTNGIIDRDGDLVVAGLTSCNPNQQPNVGGYDAWIIKFKDLRVDEKPVPPAANTWQITPMPSNCYKVWFAGDGLRYPIALTLTDARGKQIKQLSATSSETIIDLSSYAQGIYFLSSPLGAKKLLR